MNGPTTATRTVLMNAIRKAYPDVWMKKSEMFDGREDAIWTGEGSTIIVDDFEEDVFNIDNEDYDEKYYTTGVLNEFAKFLDGFGWYCEFVDSGTVMIYKI